MKSRNVRISFRFFLLFLFSLPVLPVSGESLIFKDHNNQDYFFYVPEVDETQELFNMINYLSGVDRDQTEFNGEEFSRFIDALYGGTSIHSLVFESFLLDASSSYIRTIVLNYFDSAGIDDELSLAIRRKYAATEPVVESGLPNDDLGYQNEDINLFSFSKADFFEGDLSLYMLRNDWIKYSSNRPDRDKDREVIIFSTGSGTNAMSLTIAQFRDLSIDSFQEEAVLTDRRESQYENWTILVLEPSGILTLGGADNVWVSLGSGPESNVTDSATFNIYLYNEELQTGYSVGYYMIISDWNNCYQVRHRMWNRLLMQLPLVFINDDN